MSDNVIITYITNQYMSDNKTTNDMVRIVICKKYMDFYVFNKYGNKRWHLTSFEPKCWEI